MVSTSDIAGRAHPLLGSAAPARGANAEARQFTSFHVDTLSPGEWDWTANEFSDLTYDQVACFSDGHWGAHRTSNLVLRRAGAVIGGARVALLRLPGLARGLAYVRFGPIWRRRGEPADIATYRAALTALIEEYCRRRGHCLTVIPRPNPEFYAHECRVLDELGFVARRRFRDANRYVVDLAFEEDALRQNLGQKWRYNLKQALRTDLEIRVCDDAQGIEAFTRLHKSMVARKQFYDADPVHLLPQLAAELPARMRPHIVLAFHQGRPVVGATIALLGDTAFYVFGASDHGALPHKAGYALQWWIARWLAKQNVRWYDLGGEAFNGGLRQFKRGFVGKGGCVLVARGEFDFWLDYRSRVAADAIYAARAAWRALRMLRYGR